MIEIFILLTFIFILNFILKKNNFLLNYTGQSHQTYNQGQNIPLTGGIFILIFFYYKFQYFNFDLIIFLSFFFLLGLLTDLDYIKNPIYRFLFQILLLIFFIFYNDISINDIRIDLFNSLLSNYYFNFFFVLFCFLVLINGANFIDGNNGISLGYFLIIFVIIMNLINKDLISYDINFFLPFLIVLSILLILNLFNQLYLGDSGVYLLSLFSGYLLIDIFAENQNLSPYFIVNIFWYPAFEILFSLIRKIKSKYSPLMPDTSHLHQLLFLFYSKKINLNKNYLNSITGVTINLFNGIFLYLTSLSINNTKIQILFLFGSLFVYLMSYFILSKSKIYLEK